MSHFGSTGVGCFGPISKVDCFSPILWLGHFGLICFCVFGAWGEGKGGEGGGGVMDWLEVEFRLDKAVKSTVMYLMMSDC